MRKKKRPPEEVARGLTRSARHGEERERYFTIAFFMCPSAFLCTGV